VIEEFGPDEFETRMHKLPTSLSEFEIYMYHLLSMDPSLSTKFFITQFIIGLKDELRIQAQTNITQASVFAKIQEEDLDANRPRHRLVPAGRPPPTPMPALP
jgi:hypothetical protein